MAGPRLSLVMSALAIGSFFVWLSQVCCWKKIVAMRDRREIILQHIDKNGFGIEIGPSHAPIAPKKDGYKVHIIDHLSREMLIEKYKEENVQIDNIEEVDFVWNGEPYVDLTGRPNYYDWIIASHVVEHIPDLIEFMKDCDSILNENGVLSLAVPNSNCCFDFFRPISGISKVIDAHHQKSKIHSPGTAVEHVLNVSSRDGQTTWNRKFSLQGDFGFYHSVKDARQAMEAAKAHHHHYQDFHAWCFSPHSFRLLVYDLFCLGLIPLREISFFPTSGFEFFITLGRNGSGPAKNRLEMLKAVKAEISVLPNPSEIIRSGLTCQLRRGILWVRRLGRLYL